MKAIRVNRYWVPFIAVIALLGSVWVAKAAGVWQTSGRGVILVDEYGEADPEGIKGWMTLYDVSSVYDVPLQALYTMIGAGPEVPPETALKDLEKLVEGMEVWAVRAGVAACLEGSWTPKDGRYTGETIEEPQEPTPRTEPPEPTEPEPTKPELTETATLATTETAPTEPEPPATGRTRMTAGPTMRVPPPPASSSRPVTRARTISPPGSLTQPRARPSWSGI